MATASKSEQPAATIETSAQTKPPVRRRRWIWWTAACVLLVALAPTLVAKTPLRNLGLAAALRSASAPGQATLGAASLGWFSPVVVTDFEFRGSDGQLVASLPELSIDKSLIGFLLNHSDLGHIRLQQPQVVWRVTDDVSNVAGAHGDPMAKDMNKIASERNKLPLTFEIEVVDGTVTLDDVTAQRQWKLEHVNLQMVQSDAMGPRELSLAAAMPQVSAESHIKLQANSTPKTTEAGDVSGQPGPAATLEVVQFPLEALRAIVARTSPGTSFAGQLDGRFEFTPTVGGTANDGTLSGDITVANLLLTAPGLGDDVLRIDRVESPCQLSLHGDNLAIDKLAVRTDIGQMTCTGNITLAPAEAAPQSADPMSRLVAAAGNVKGEIDLAEVARRRPQAMRLRPGMELVSTPIKFDVSPRLHRDNGWMLELAAGRVVDHVHATPQLCDAWLKFALPVVAEVTRVDGEFSVDLEGFRLPLANRPATETAGNIEVHYIELEPGPLAQEFLPVLDTLRGLLGREGSQPLDRLSLARDSQVEFRVVDGRVYHRGLRLQFPELTVETHGSVGFDESVAMIAEIHLPGKLLGDKSGPLELPIGGTLKKPKVDVSQLRGFGKQTVREAAKGIIGEKVERELNRLFKP